MKHPDIFIGQTDAEGRVQVLERTEQAGFVYYKPRQVRLKIKYAVSNDEGVYEPKQRKPRGIREARRARREYIATMESMGLTVKGKQYINLGLVRELNADRLEWFATLTKVEDIKTYWTEESFISIRDTVYNYDDFGEIPMGTIKHAMERGEVYACNPKADAPEV